MLVLFSLIYVTNLPDIFFELVSMATFCFTIYFYGFCMFQFIRANIFVVVTPLSALFFALLVLLARVMGNSKPDKLQKYPVTWARIILGLVGVKVRVEGAENIAPEQTYVFVANHASQFDIYSFQAYFPHDFRWLAKKELFSLPVFGAAMRVAGMIPIDRSRGKAAFKSLQDAAATIKEGSSVLVFPEGSRSEDGRLTNFKPGAFVLALKAAVPLVPIGFNYTSKVLPKGKLLPRKGEIVIRIGKPVAIDGYSSKDKHKLALVLEKKVAELLEPAHLPHE